MTDDPLERAVQRHHASTARYLFRIHLAVYLAVNAFLVVVWALTSNGFTVIPWFLFPLGGWGIALAAHYAASRPRP